MRLPLLALILIALMAPRAEAGRGTSLVKYLPDDATVVVVVDVAKSRRSPIFKKGFEAVRQKHEWLDHLASSVALDKLVDTIVFGGTQDAAQHFVAVLEGKVDKLLAEIKKTSTKSETHGGTTYWVTPDGEAALVDKRLVLATAGDMPTVIDRAADKKAKGPVAVRTMLAAATPTSAVFGGAVLDAQTKADIAKEIGGEPQWAAVSMAMARKLTMSAKLKLADDAGAEKVARTLNERLGGTVRSQAEGWIGKEFSESITVDQDHAFARLSATLTADEIDKILSLAKMFM